MSAALYQKLDAASAEAFGLLQENIRLGKDNAKLRAALEHMKLVAETDGLDQWVEFIDAALNEQKP